MNAKYTYHSESTLHNPLELHEDGEIHTWTLHLNGDYFHVTREVWEAFHAEKECQAAQLAAQTAVIEAARYLLQQVKESGFYLDTAAECDELHAALAELDKVTK